MNGSYGKPARRSPVVLNEVVRQRASRVRWFVGLLGAAGNAMKYKKVKQIRRHHRKTGIRKRVFGTPERPRLTVYRSLKHILCSDY